MRRKGSETRDHRSLLLFCFLDCGFLFIHGPLVRIQSIYIYIPPHNSCDPRRPTLSKKGPPLITICHYVCMYYVCVCVCVIVGHPYTVGTLELRKCEYILWCVCHVTPFSYNIQQCQSQCWGKLAPYTVTYSTSRTVYGTRGHVMGC